MDAKQIEAQIIRAKTVIEAEVRDRLPRKVGTEALKFVNQNFRDSGFHDGGLHEWPRARRQDDPYDKDRKYKTLLSRRMHLSRSTDFRPGVAEVTIFNPVPYAAIHNEGGTITTHPTITPRMRKMAWAKVYAIAGVKKGKGEKKGKLPKQIPAEALKWKALALTKKTKLTVKATIPKRQFMGNSAELSAKVRELINQSIQNVRKQLSRFT